MTAVPSIDPAQLLGEQLERAEPDLLRALLKTFVEALMGAEADAVCGAGYRERQRGPGELAQRLPGAGVGHPRRHRRAGHSQAQERKLLPRLAARAAQAG